MNWQATGQFPVYRPRRLRQSPVLRRLVSETELSADHLVLPLFVRTSQGMMPTPRAERIAGPIRSAHAKGGDTSPERQRRDEASPRWRLGLVG